jgi:hypothetical protein
MERQVVDSRAEIDILWIGLPASRVALHRIGESEEGRSRAAPSGGDLDGAEPS